MCTVIIYDTQYSYGYIVDFIYVSNNVAIANDFIVIS